MKKLFQALLLTVITLLFVAGPVFAAEYFVIKSRSGILKVVDHRPKKGATIEKGPFKSHQEAIKAMREIKASTTKK